LFEQFADAGALVESGTGQVLALARRERPIDDAIDRGGRDDQEAVDRFVASRAASTIVLVVQPGRTVT
jgi:hypothetical protein